MSPARPLWEQQRMADGSFEVTASAYSAEQYADNYHPGMEYHWWTCARASIVQRAVDRFPGAVILDVGCGPGLVVRHLREHGYNCHGCEIGRPVVHAAVAEAIQTGVDALDLQLDFRLSVGVILLLDVLEHLQDPQTFLSSLLAAFPNLRGVIITVPARQELWSAWDERFGHYMRYDRSSLATLCTKSGLKVQRLRYFFQCLYPVLLAVSHTSGRATKIAGPRRRSLPHTLLSYLFRIEEALPIGRAYGSSLIAVTTPNRDNARF